MRARLIVALGAGDVAPEERHQRDLSTFETVELTGADRGDWAAARDAVDVPAGALQLAWFRDE